MNMDIIKNLIVGKLITRFGMPKILAVTAAVLVLPYVIKKISGRDIREGRVGQILDKLDFSEYIPWLRNMKGSRASRTA